MCQPPVAFYAAHVFKFLTLNSDSLSTIPAIPTSKPNSYGSRSMEINNNPTPGKFPTRRCSLSSSQLVSHSFDGMPTVTMSLPLTPPRRAHSSHLHYSKHHLTDLTFDILPPPTNP
ncbi:hypothetical protein GYMLUDRAFT_253473 [Collybiopsis luxurians FD-317 M1]|uniref:Uncharacterized protein n=1 Tax=Collybiopsis luxurians FD-317 M1 TaxID=944289 RepID=A0A0D0AID6_9AGAR|nr:hypothetical protein GYMLUDRAFT_253473 [Collybiopsis luxurians FD-317 M1]